MSAIMITGNTLRTLAIAIVRRGCVDRRIGGVEQCIDAGAVANRVAGALWRMNAAAIRQRYPRNAETYIAEAGMVPETSAWETLGAAYALPGGTPVAPAHAAGSLAALCSFYEYQVCEADAWETSPERAMVDALRCSLLRDLPGYESAHGAWR